MSDFEKEVEYLLHLIKNNINIVTTNKPEGISTEELVFFNWNMSKDGQEIAVYNQEKDVVYDIVTKKIETSEFQKVKKEKALNIITLLRLYANKKISFNNMIKRYKEEMGYEYYRL